MNGFVSLDAKINVWYYETKEGYFLKNIPMFTTDSGVASLILDEIPYKAEAYIRIHSASNPDKLIKETVSFCKAVGADVVFAAGHDFLERYPLHTQILRMECVKAALPTGTVKLQPVEESTLLQWCEIYNTYMKNVPNAATMTHGKAKGLLRNNCFYVYENGTMLGIGMVSDKGIDAIVSLVRGRGMDVMLALCTAVRCAVVSVEVASNNIPAIKLYQKLGFTRKETISKWYCVSRKST